MSTNRKRCKHKVFSGARWDMRGHPCGNYALEGSEFCHVHDEGRKAERSKAAAERRKGQPAKAEPEVSTHAAMLYRAELKWEPGLGPIVAVPYRDRPGYVTFLSASARNDQEPRMEVRGVMVKADGSPGQQSWRETYGLEKFLPREVVEQLDKALQQARSEVLS